MHNHAAFYILAFLLVPIASGTTHHVEPDGSGDFPTIQAAIEAAADGDSIQLGDGIFTGEGNRDIVFLGKAILIQSQSGDPSTCTIACGYSARGFTFGSHGGPIYGLDGITIANGFDVHGAGVYCGEQSPIITNCRFVECHATDSGGGIFINLGGEPILSNCQFIDCYAGGYGGAMRGCSAAPSLNSCTFIGNYACIDGGGIWLNSLPNPPPYPELVNCTFYECGSGNSGGGVYEGADSRVLNVLIAFSTGGGAYRGTEETILTCCNFYGNEGGDWVGDIASQYGITGNISEDPLFCDPESGNLYLAEDSPCAPFSPPNTGCDMIGAWPVGCAPMSVLEPWHAGNHVRLLPPSPNPFTASTRLAYYMPEGNSRTVILDVHDASGRLICCLVNAIQSPGQHCALWDGTDDAGESVAAGAYFYRMSVGEKTATRQVLFVQ